MTAPRTCASRRPSLPDFVFDSYAVLAFLFGEPSAPEVRGILEDAAQAEQPVLMTTVNWAEVLYRVRRKRGEAGVQEARRFEETMPVVVLVADHALAEAAAEFKAAHKMSLADAFAAALAQREDAELVTGDPELKALHGQIKLRWLG